MKRKRGDRPRKRKRGSGVNKRITEMIGNSDSLVAEYLAEHPEHAAEFGCHKEHGALMTTRGTRLFVEWAMRTGRVPKENMAKASDFMNKIENFGKENP